VSKPSSTLVVIPAYNEVATVGEVVRRTRDAGLSSLVVDDGSSDDTVDAARRAGAVVISMPVNLGVGAAMRAGFKYAVGHGYQRVVQVDADLQHPPEAIHLLTDVADTGIDLVIGSRFAHGYKTGFSRRIMMRIVAGGVSRLVGVRLDDVTSGFRVVSEPLLRHFAQRYPAEYLGDTVESLLQAHSVGASIAQVEVPMDQRIAGVATSPIRAGGHLARLAVSVVAGKPRSMAK